MAELNIVRLEEIESRQSQRNALHFVERDYPVAIGSPTQQDWPAVSPRIIILFLSSARITGTC